VSNISKIYFLGSFI